MIGGGTSAAEAVIAISGAKNAAGDPTDVYWSYRGDKMPKVSRALADEFFEAFVGNGNVRYLPSSEPVAVLEVGDESFLSVRTNRIVAQGCPPETTQLEFRKTLLHRLHRRGHSRGAAREDRRAARRRRPAQQEAHRASARCSRRGSRTSISPATC